MVNLRKFLKPYKESGAFHSLLAPHRFIDGRVFLTKGNQLGIVLSLEGIDYECLTETMLESHTPSALLRPGDASTSGFGCTSTS